MARGRSPLVIGQLRRQPGGARSGWENESSTRLRKSTRRSHGASRRWWTARVRTRRISGAGRRRPPLLVYFECRAALPFASTAAFHVDRSYPPIAASFFGTHAPKPPAKDAPLAERAKGRRLFVRRHIAGLQPYGECSRACRDRRKTSNLVSPRGAPVRACYRHRGIAHDPPAGPARGLTE
jgi:hypothetical protein